MSKEKGRADLTSMWEKTANAILRALNSDEPSAASLEVARKFLADNSTTIRELQTWQNHPLGFDPGRLPTFPDDDDSDSTPADPLKAVPPFVDNTTTD